jgi:hypothetical protein
MKMPLYAPLGAVVTPIPRHFATWRKTTNTKQLLRIRSLAKKSFGETFGAATGVSDPQLQKRRRNLSSSSLLSGPIHPDPAAKLLARLHGL